jgi:hypothetical protein
VLAYVFWHRPADGVAPGDYEDALRRFQRSLTARPPGGFIVSATLRVPGCAWLAGADAYEDWYVVEDFAALGVLNEAAIGRGHRSAHDDAARQAGPGTAAIFRLLEGSPTPADARVAVWIDKPRGVENPLLAPLLGDGMDAERAGLWQRQLALGPSPEYCLLAREVPAGVDAGRRLAQGWTAVVSARELV